MKRAGTPKRDAALTEFIHTRNSILTKEKYGQVLRRAFEFVGDKELDRITLADMAAFKDSLSHLHPNTVHLYVVALKVFFDFCVERELVLRSPVKRLKAPRAQQRPPGFLTEEESVRLLESIDRESLYGKRNYAIISLLLSTGIRGGEALRVRFADFFVDDLKDIFLNIPRGKGDKARRVKVPGETYAAVQEFLVAVCRYQPLNVREFPLCLALRGHKSRWLPGDVPGERMSARQLEEIVRRAGRKAGIEKRICPHMLRHTCFTLELMAGASLLQIKEQAGHAYLGTTQRYLHQLENMKHNAVDRNPLFMRALPQEDRDSLKRGIVSRLERLGVARKVVETVREELCLDSGTAPFRVDTERWMPMEETLKVLVHLNRSRRSLRKAVLESDLKVLERNGRVWVWRDQVMELVEDFVTMSEASRTFGIDKRTLRRWARKGVLQAPNDLKRWGGKSLVRFSRLKKVKGAMRTKGGRNADISAKRGHKKALKGRAVKR